MAADSRAACTAESAGPHHPSPQRAGTPVHDSRAPHQLLLKRSERNGERIRGWTGAVADPRKGRRTGALPTVDYDQLSASHAAPARRGLQSPHRFARSSSPTRCSSSPALPVSHRLVRHGSRTARDRGQAPSLLPGRGPPPFPPLPCAPTSGLARAVHTLCCTAHRSQLTRVLLVLQDGATQGGAAIARAASVDGRCAGARHRRRAPAGSSGGVSGGACTRPSSWRASQRS